MSLLVRKELQENWRQIALFWAGIFGLLVIISLLVARGSHHNGIQPECYSSWSIENFLGWITVVFLICGAYVAAYSFKRMATSPGALSTLMTPASQFEKFAIKWLIAVPVYILIFCLIAYVADWIRVYSSYWMFDIEVRPVNVTKILFHQTTDIGFVNRLAFHSLFYFLAGQSFFLLGSIVWPKNSALRTFVCMIAICFIYVWIGIWFVSLLDISDGDTHLYYSGPEFLNDDRLLYVADAFAIIVAVINYWLTYRRFREAETINRW
ncbi:MAG TPA: hypothetical protein DD424_00625 [Porphyromonadaceae bacterium]|nr:hypothetical protein [Porphyromonadaceae bacterium]